MFQSCHHARSGAFAPLRAFDILYEVGAPVTLVCTDGIQTKPGRYFVDALTLAC